MQTINLCLYIKCNIIIWNMFVDNSYNRINNILFASRIYHNREFTLISSPPEDRRLISLGVNLDKNSRIDSILTERGHYLF